MSTTQSQPSSAAAAAPPPSSPLTRGKMSSTSFFLFLFLFLVVALLPPPAAGDVESDRKECGEALMALATCLPYVGGNSKSPTPDCCTGLKQMLSGSPKCLCLLIKDHDNPAVDLKMDPVRAMSLPSDCGAPANISHCPKLLNLPPNSPDAKIFDDFKNKSHENSTTHGTSAGLSSNNELSYAGRNGFLGIGEGDRWRWMATEMILCLATSLLVMIFRS